MQVKHIALVALVGLLCTQAMAAESVWQGTGGDTNWSTGANWVGGTAPATNSGNDIVFVSDPYAGTKNSVTLTGGTTIGQLTFTSTCPTGFTIFKAGGGYSLTSSGTTTVQAQTSANAFTIEGQLIPAKTSLSTFDYGFDVGTNGTLNVGSFNTALNLAGTTVTIKVGAGTLTFAGQARSASFNVNAGVVNFNGTGNQILNLTVDPAAACNFGAASNTTFYGNVSGPLTFADGAKLTFSTTFGGSTISSNIDVGGASTVSYTKGTNITVAPVFNGNINLRGSATFSNGSNVSLTFNGAVTVNDTANFSLGNALAPTWGPLSSVTLNGGKATIRGSGTVFAPITLNSSTALLTMQGGNWAGGFTPSSGINLALNTGGIYPLGPVTFTDVVNITCGNNGVFGGDINMTLSSSGTISGVILKGGLSLSNDATLNMKPARIDGTLSVSDLARVTFPAGRGPDIRGAVSLSGNAQMNSVVGTDYGKNNQVNIQGTGKTFSMTDDTRMNVWSERWQFADATFTDNAIADITYSDDASPGNIVVSGNASLKMTGGFNSSSEINGTVTVSGHGFAKIGADGVNSVFTIVGPDARLQIAQGYVRSDINGLLDSFGSQFTLGGGYDADNDVNAPLMLDSYMDLQNNSLTLGSNLNVPAGGRTLNIPDWDKPLVLTDGVGFKGQEVHAFTDPVVYLTQVTGSGDIVKTGGNNSGLAFSSTTGYSWTGNVVLQNGYFMISGQHVTISGLGSLDPAGPSGADPNWINVATIPVGLNDIIMSANGKILSCDASTTLTGKDIRGLGQIVADSTIDGPGVGTIVFGGATLEVGVGRGTVGKMTVKGDLQMAAAAEVSLILTGTLSECGLVVTGDTGHGNLTGIENAVLNIDLRPVPGKVTTGPVQIITCANDLSASSFASVTWINESGVDFKVRGGTISYVNGGVIMTGARSTIQKGDGNGDLTVDQADYALYFNNYGNSGLWGPGDINGDGTVDQADYADYFNNYGQTYGGSGAVTPEPATMALLALGGLALLRRRK